MQQDMEIVGKDGKVLSESLEMEIEEDMDEEESDDDREDQMEDDMEVQREIADIEETDVPTPEQQQSVLSFLREILDSKERLNTANLTPEELGKPAFSTRYWINLASTIDKVYGLDLVKEYCLRKAHITSDTSLSKDGFILQLPTTQKKIKERKSGNSEYLNKLLARGNK